MKRSNKLFEYKHPFMLAMSGKTMMQIYAAIEYLTFLQEPSISGMYRELDAAVTTYNEKTGTWWFWYHLMRQNWKKKLPN